MWLLAAAVRPAPLQLLAPESGSAWRGYAGLQRRGSVGVGVDLVQASTGHGVSAATPGADQ